MRATARSLTGEEATAQSPWIKLAPAPKASPAQPRPKPQKQQKQRTIPNLTLRLEPDQVLIGGRMVTTIHYGFDQDAMVKLLILDDRGKIIKTILNNGSNHSDKGKYKLDVDLSRLDYGNYTVLLEATNFYGTRQATKMLSVTYR